MFAQRKKKISHRKADPRDGRIKRSTFSTNLMMPQIAQANHSNGAQHNGNQAREKLCFVFSLRLLALTSLDLIG